MAGGVGGYMYGGHGPGDIYWISICGVYNKGDVGTIISWTSCIAGVYITGVPVSKYIIISLFYVRSAEDYLLSYKYVFEEIIETEFYISTIILVCNYSFEKTWYLLSSKVFSTFMSISDVYK